jgi:prepilin-type N-terminal cleavage/methylation domain-containing protein
MKRNAFSMLELIFVIVVVGILAKFGTDLYLQIAEGYARSLYINELQSKSANAIQTMANRLTYRIKDSVKSSNIGSTTVGWKGMDIDGWRADSWSGIVDLALGASTASQLSSPGTSAGSELFFIGSNVGTGNNEYHTVTAGTNVLNGTFSGMDVFEYYQMTDGNHTITQSGSTLTLDGNPLVNDVTEFMVEKLGDGIHIHLCVGMSNPLLATGSQVCKDKFVF